jgi:hypothetical protein
LREEVDKIATSALVLWRQAKANPVGMPGGQIDHDLSGAIRRAILANDELRPEVRTLS